MSLYIYSFYSMKTLCSYIILYIYKLTNYIYSIKCRSSMFIFICHKYNIIAGPSQLHGLQHLLGPRLERQDAVEGDHVGLHVEALQQLEALRPVAADLQQAVQADHGAFQLPGAHVLPHMRRNTSFLKASRCWKASSRLVQEAITVLKLITEGRTW